MGFSIGPIDLTFLEAHSWDVRRQTEIVSIPFARQTGFSVGSELVSYQLTGAFHADTDAEAKVLRRQLNELFNNHDIDFEYIEFDVDDDELSGWFLLDSINTQIIPGIFGDYPFSCSVRRLGNLSSHLIGTYWTSNPFSNDYGLSGREWVAAPNSLGSQGNDSRSGDGGTNYILTTSLDSPIVYQDQLVSNYYEMSCRVYETSGDPSDALNGVAAKTEIFNPEREQNKNSIIFTNGLIAVVFNETSSPILELYIYDTSAISWNKVVDEFIIGDSSGDYRLYTTRLAQRPIIEKISHEEVTFRLIHTTALGLDQNALTVQYTLKRGTYFFEVYLPAHGNIISGTRTRLFSSSATGAITTTSNVSTVSNSTGQIGFIYTETASPTTTGADIRLGYDIAANDNTTFGILIAPPAYPSGTTAANLGNEFIANITQKPVLIDPRWL